MRAGRRCLGEGDSLPDEGHRRGAAEVGEAPRVRIRVVIPDASARTFPEATRPPPPLHHHQPRHLRHLTILSNGDLTELLG